MKNEIFAIGVMTLVAGCVAPKPETLTITDSDREFYKGPGSAMEVSSPKASIAIWVSEGNYRNCVDVRNAIDAKLTDDISSVSYFTIADRSNLKLMMEETNFGEFLPGQDVSISADYVLTAKISALSGGKRAGAFIVNGKEVIKHNAAVTLDFRMYRVVNGKMKLVLAKTMSDSNDGMAEGEVSEWISNSCRKMAEKFFEVMVHSMTPTGRVLEARGGGRVVRISIGSNFGIAKGCEVEFYEIMDNSDIVKGEDFKYDRSMVARGLVLETDETSAWVEICDRKRVRVKRGHYVRMTDQTNKRTMNIFTRFFGEVF